MRTSWLNSTRLRIYPRLIYITTSVVLLFNALLGNGWIGASGQMIGGDFIMLYSSGVLFQQDPGNLYDFDHQARVQQKLVAPIKMWGVMPFNYPPYVAAVTSFISHIPLPLAFILMTIISITSVALSSILVSNYLLPDKLSKSNLPALQVFFIIASSFAFTEGLQMGQNHGLTLLFLTASIVFSLRQQWFIAGIMAGFLLYKPHFALGFVIIWFFMKRWRALFGFSTVAAAWAGTFLIRYGWQPFLNYLSNSTLLLKMVYLKGFGGYLEVTPYGLLIDLLPDSAWLGIIFLTQLIFVCFTVYLAFITFKLRDKSAEDQISLYMLAVFFPLIVSPHALLHDLVIVVPALALWARFWQHRNLFQITIVVYISTFVLPLLTYVLDIALLSLIPIGLTSLLIVQISQQFLNKKPELII